MGGCSEGTLFESCLSGEMTLHPISEKSWAKENEPRHAVTQIPCRLQAVTDKNACASESTLENFLVQFYYKSLYVEKIYTCPASQGRIAAREM